MSIDESMDGLIIGALVGISGCGYAKRWLGRILVLVFHLIRLQSTGQDPFTFQWFHKHLFWSMSSCPPPAAPGTTTVSPLHSYTDTTTHWVNVAGGRLGQHLSIRLIDELISRIGSPPPCNRWIELDESHSPMVFSRVAFSFFCLEDKTQTLSMACPKSYLHCIQHVLNVWPTH